MSVTVYHSDFHDKPQNSLLLTVWFDPGIPHATVRHAAVKRLCTVAFMI